MVLPDVLKCRTQAFFQFSPGKEKKKLGSDLLTFRRKKKKKRYGGRKSVGNPQGAGS